LTFDFSLVSALSILAPIMVGAFFVKRFNRNFQILFVLTLVTFLIEIGARILYELRTNNMIFNHIQCTVEFYILAFLYLRLFRNSLDIKITLVLMVLFALITTGSLVFYESFWEFNALQRYFEMLFLTVIIFIYVREQTLRYSEASVRKNPFFLLSVGYLIYLSGTLLLFVNQKYFIEIGKTQYWVVHGIFNIFLNVVITLVLWKGRKYSLS